MSEKIIEKTKRLERLNLTRLAELTVRFVLGFILSGATLFGSISPFAAAMAACSGAGLNGLSALVGISLGYLIFCPFSWALKYICISVLIVAAAAVFRGTDVYHSAWFMPLTAFLAALFVGLITYSPNGWALKEIIYISCDSVIAGGCAFFYSLALAPWVGQINLERGEQISHTISILIMLGTLLISLSGVTIFGIISVGRVFAAVIVLLAAYSGGVGMGCATGITMGLAMDSASGAPPIFSLAYGVAGLISGIFARQSRFLFTVVFVVVDAAAAVLAIGSDTVPSILYEVFIASVAFVAAPSQIIHRMTVLIPEKSRNAGAARAREYTKNRVELASFAFRELYNTFTENSRETEETENVSIVFNRAADAVCKKCRRSADCWQTNYTTTMDAMNDATSAMLERGMLEKNDISAHFIDECVNPDAYVTAVNLETRALLYRRRLRNRLRGSRDIVYSQYSEMSDILNGVAFELGAGLGFEPELENKMRRYLQSQGITADVGVFRDKGGRLHAEVSGDLGALRSDDLLLDKLSAALNVRLCVPEGRIPANRIELLEAEPLTAAIGISRMNKAGELVSGDCGAFFKTAEGMLYVLLSDGMGSGEAAAKSSGDAVRILERFLRSGVAPETAVRLINNIMMMQSEIDTTCATVDLAEISLFTGDVTLLKYGAAPSYVKNGGAVRRVRGRSLAAGLGLPEEPDIWRLTVRPGGIAVVVSDGVTSGGDDSALISFIAGFDQESEPDVLSRSIVEFTRALGKTDDDVTAIVIKLKERQ